VRLGKVIRAYRHHQEISMRGLAKDLGIGAATLMRVEHDYAIDAKTFLLILKWLTNDPDVKP
jgi:transcriptional regulator with XRE-family HTH domain